MNGSGIADDFTTGYVLCYLNVVVSGSNSSSWRGVGSRGTIGSDCCSSGVGVGGIAEPLIGWGTGTTGIGNS